MSCPKVDKYIGNVVGWARVELVSGLVAVRQNTVASVSNKLFPLSNKLFTADQRTVYQIKASSDVT